MLQEFDRLVGVDRIAVVHLNDSKNPVGAGKDRHTPIGTGYIGYDTIRNIVNHELLKDRPFILETPWIGKDAKTQQPMYEAEIALLRGNVAERFGEQFLTQVEELHAFFLKSDTNLREFVLSTWDLLKSDAKARKADPREPLERLYDTVVQASIFPELTEQEINHRLIALLSGKELLVNA
ncbi:putative endonuclease 4 [compost metagenome]